jgi:hypothetical protein
MQVEGGGRNMGEEVEGGEEGNLLKSGVCVCYTDVYTWGWWCVCISV